MLLILQSTEESQNHLTLVYHKPSQRADVSLDVVSESVFISPFNSVTLRLFTCYTGESNIVQDVEVRIKYETAGNLY